VHRIDGGKAALLHIGQHGPCVVIAFLTIAGDRFSLNGSPGWSAAIGASLPARRSSSN
jgi:hypothetical protein